MGFAPVIGSLRLPLVIALLLPKPLERVAAAVSSQPVISGGIGLLTVILAPLVAILLTITIILIPFAIRLRWHWQLPSSGLDCRGWSLKPPCKSL